MIDLSNWHNLQLNEKINRIAREASIQLLSEVAKINNNWIDVNNFKIKMLDGAGEYIVKDCLGCTAWIKQGKYHRVDGPSIIYSDGSCKWYINDEQLTKEQFEQWQKDNL